MARVRWFPLASLGFVVALGCAACGISIGGSGEVSRSSVETNVAKDLAADTNQPTPKVTCPSGLPGRVHASIECTLTPKGSTTKLPVRVTVNSVHNGTAHYTAQVGQIAGAGNKTTFCQDNAILDKATVGVTEPSQLVAIFKANQRTITNFRATAPPSIVDEAGAMVLAADHAISSGNANAFAGKALMRDGQKVDAYCGQNADGSPVAGSGGATTSSS